MPLAHGGALKLTTSHYFTPSGASIQGVGLIPDIVENGPDEVADAESAQTHPPLAVRDPDVHTGLATLKTRGVVAASKVPAGGALARDLIP